MTRNAEAGELLKRFCDEGDQAAFNRFYRQQSGRLWRFLRIRGCTEEAAYDLVAEAFSRFIGAVCRDPAAPVALLYRVAINLHIDEYRRDRASPVFFDNTVQDSATAPIADEALRDQLQLVRHYLGDLPQDEQKLLLMRYWSGLTHREIAAILEMPEGTVRRQAAAAINKIRSQWQNDET